jgi:hypothetical protein
MRTRSGAACALAPRAGCGRVRRTMQAFAAAPYCFRGSRCPRSRSSPDEDSLPSPRKAVDMPPRACH